MGYYTDSAGTRGFVASPVPLPGAALPGDLDGSSTVDIADAILALCITSGIGAPNGMTIHTENCVASGRIGMEGMLYVIQHTAGLR